MLRIKAVVVAVVVKFEGAVVRQIQTSSGRTNRRRHRAAHLGVGVRRKLVADVVQQCHHHVLLVAAVAQRAGGALQRVLIAGRLVAGEAALERLYGGE